MLLDGKFENITQSILYGEHSRVARFHELISQTIIRAAKKTKETKTEYQQKQKALIKVWLIYSCNLATLEHRLILTLQKNAIGKQLRQ